MASGVRGEFHSSSMSGTEDAVGASRNYEESPSVDRLGWKSVKMKYSSRETCHAISDAWQTLSVILLPDSSLERVLKYVRVLFRNTVQFTMSLEFDCLEIETKKRLKLILEKSPHLPCQLLSQLLPDPWTRFPIRSLFLRDNESGDTSFDRNRPLQSVYHSCTSACLMEPRHLSRARVDVLTFADFDMEALQLCLACDSCYVLKKDSFYKATAFRLLYSMEKIAQLTTEVSKMTCHDGYHLMQQIQSYYGLAADTLLECLAQIFLVRDFVGPSSYCCTLALINLWCSLHVYQQSNLDVLAQEARKLGLLASTSAHIYLFVDALYNQYGRRLLVLYLHLYVHALTWDLNNLEYYKLLDCDITVVEMEVHLAAIYSKLASLLALEEDLGLARECILTAFSLEPTAERLSYLQKWSTFVHTAGPPRLNPCAGECHCAEKGLCRQVLPDSRYYASHVPHEILDTTLGAGLIPHQLLQDLCIVVEGPRCKRLSWSVAWPILKEICERILKHVTARRSSANGESLEARLRRRTQFEKWVNLSRSSDNLVVLKQEPLDIDDDNENDEIMPILKREVTYADNHADANATVRTQVLQNSVSNVKSCSVVRQVTDVQDPAFSVPNVNENYQMSRMDCLELEEAVRQLTDTSTSAADAQDMMVELRYHQVDSSSQQQQMQTSFLVDGVQMPCPIVQVPTQQISRVHLTAAEQQQQQQQQQLNSMSTLQSLLDSVSTMNPEYGQMSSSTSCEGIELLANSAIQFGSLVGLQRPPPPPLPPPTPDPTATVLASLTPLDTTTSMDSSCQQQELQATTTTTSQVVEVQQEMQSHQHEGQGSSPAECGSQFFSEANQRRMPASGRSGRGIPMSLSELVQSVLSDDPPLVSPSQTSLDYNWPNSCAQQTTAQTFETTNNHSTSAAASTTSTFAFINDASTSSSTHIYQQDVTQLGSVASSAVPSRVTLGAPIAHDHQYNQGYTSSPTLMMCNNNIQQLQSTNRTGSGTTTLTLQSIPEQRNRTVLLTMATGLSTATTFEPKYLTVQTSSPSIPKTRKCIFRKVPVTTSTTAATTTTNNNNIKKIPRVPRTPKATPSPRTKNTAARTAAAAAAVSNAAKIIQQVSQGYVTSDLEAMADSSASSSSDLVASMNTNVFWPYGHSNSNSDSISTSRESETTGPLAYNDILSQATITALGEESQHEQQEAVIVEPQFSSNTVPTALQILAPDSHLRQPDQLAVIVASPATTTVTTTTAAASKRRPVFNHRTDRCKWMSVFSPFGKLGYRKVVEESKPIESASPPTTSTSTTTSTAFSVPVCSSVSKVTVPTASPASTNLTTISSTSFAPTATVPIKPPLPVVKKCYSPILIGGPSQLSNHHHHRPAKSMPRVFTVSAPRLPLVRPSLASSKRTPIRSNPKTTTTTATSAPVVFDSGVGTFVSVPQTFLKSGFNQQQQQLLQKQQQQQLNGEGGQTTIRTQILAYTPPPITSSVGPTCTAQPHIAIGAVSTKTSTVCARPTASSTALVSHHVTKDSATAVPESLSVSSARAGLTASSTAPASDLVNRPVPESLSASAVPLYAVSAAPTLITCANKVSSSSSLLSSSVSSTTTTTTTSSSPSPSSSNGVTLNQIQTTAMLQPKVVLEQCVLIDGQLEQSSSSASTTTPTSPRYERVPCPVCDKVLSSAYCTRRHMRCVHKISTPPGGLSPVKNIPATSPTLKVNVVRLNIDSLKAAKPPIMALPLMTTTPPQVTTTTTTTIDSQSKMSLVELQEEEDDEQDLDLQSSVVPSSPTRLVLPEQHIQSVNGQATKQEVDKVNCEQSTKPSENRTEINSSSLSIVEEKEELIRLLDDVISDADKVKETAQEPDRPKENETDVSEQQQQQQFFDVGLVEQQPEPEDELEEVKFENGPAEDGRDVSSPPEVKQQQLEDGGAEESTKDGEDDVDEDDDDDDHDDDEEELSAGTRNVQQSSTRIVTRGRTSARAIKMPAKRGCHCCENDSPNSSVVSSVTTMSSSSSSSMSTSGRRRKKRRKKGENLPRRSAIIKSAKRSLSPRRSVRTRAAATRVLSPRAAKT